MPDPTLEDYVASILLRYFKRGRQAKVHQPRANRLGDAELLRLHWAISPEVENLCNYIRQNRHEAQASLDYQQREEDIVIRGRLDARKTLLRRSVTGRPTLVAFNEPLKSYNTGPNHLVVWCILQAHCLVERLQALAPEDSSYGQRTRQVASAILDARLVASVSQAVSQTKASIRPSPRGQMQAARSRKRMYRLAAMAYQRLLGIERGVESAIRELLQQTLVAPEDTWRTFELAVVLSIGEAIAQHTGSGITIRHIVPGLVTPIVECGRFAVYWQNKTVYYSEPLLEPSEERTASILAKYGMQFGEDRPDVVVVDRVAGQVVALAEVKYFQGSGEGWRDPFRQAVAQLVRYSRGYAVKIDQSTLLSRSLIALWDCPHTTANPIEGVPHCTDFKMMTKEGLVGWVTRIIL
jgi:hypothetical protein